MTNDKLKELLGKVTQGKWYTREDSEGYWVLGEDGDRVASADAADDNVIHNALLISIAPSLARRVLAAEKMADALGDMQNTSSFMQQSGVSDNAKNAAFHNMARQAETH